MLEHLHIPREEVWVQLYTGEKFYPLAPEKSTYPLEALAHHLSHQARFGGGTKHFYSVAQHLLLCEQIAVLCCEREHDPDFYLNVLFHDAAEFILGDMVRPVKQQLPHYKTLETETHTAICREHRIPPMTDAEQSLVLRIDFLALKLEKEHLLPHATAWDDDIEDTRELDQIGREFFADHFIPRAPELVRKDFISTVNKYKQQKEEKE